MAETTVVDVKLPVDEPCADPPLLQIKNLSKTFGLSTVLENVELDLFSGEVHALVGQNGSGKSTLIKILSGYHRADAGATILIDGQPWHETLRGDPQNVRLHFIHQDLGLILELDAVDNLALHGSYIHGRLGRVCWKQQEAETRRLLTSFGVEFDVRRPLAEATPLEQVAVAIVAAIQSCDHPRSVLVLDEPTAILPSGEVHRLFKFIKELTSRGTGVLYVSHRLDEIFEIADRVTVLREGKRVATRPVEGMTKPRLVSLMLGQDLVLGNKRRETVSVETPVVLEAKGLRSRYLKGVDLALRQGEIVGLAGLPGSGREELPYALAGALSPSAIGKIRTPGSNGEWIDIEQAGDFGVTLVPANRATEGIISEMSIGENLSLMVLDRLGRRGRLNIASEKAAISKWLTRLDVRGPDFRHGVSTLSGGNQQKVLIGRCLAIEPKVLALCEPTAGVDIGARSAIFEFLLASARSGLSVLIASSDLDDLLATCDRVLVMRHGIVATELEGSSITARRIVHAMEGLDETLA